MQVNVSAGEGIVYVGGRVNGAVALFDRISGTNLWKADVDQSDDDQYLLELELIDEAGNHSEYINTLYFRLPYFVTNRTEESYLNASDLSRVEENISLLASYVNKAHDKKIWNIGDIPKVSDYDEILAEINDLRKHYIVYHDTPDTPQKPLNLYTKWNDIEKILHDMYTIFMSNQNARYYSGNDELMSQEEIGVI